MIKKLRQMIKSQPKIIHILILISCFVFADDIENKEIALYHFMQGEFLMNQGNYALAILEFQEAIELDPNASTIHVSIADGYRRLGKEERAEDHLNIALALNPNEKEALEILGQLYLNQRKYDDAELTYKRLHNLDLKNIDYIFTLADLYRIKRDWNSAIDYYIKGYEVNPLAVAGLEQALKIALTTGNYTRAEEVCEILLNDNPENLDILETMKDLSLFKKQYEKSLEILNEIQLIQGKSIDIFIQKSALYEELDKPELSLKMIYSALEIDSNSIDLLHRLVTLLINQSKNEEAILYNHKILEKYPDDPRGFINNAVMAMGGKKPKEAISVLKPYSDKFRQDFTFQYLLGIAYYQLKKYDSSEVHLSQALEIYPQSRNTKHNLALIYDSTGKWDKSDKLYLDLISSDSTDAQAYNNYAYSLVERNHKIDLALELAQIAIRLEPKSAAYLDTIGWIYFKMDFYDKALHYIKESLSIDSSNITIKEHLDEVIRVKAEASTGEVLQVEQKD
ncbi:MAG: hypothetical protein CMG60_04295 [Candidatus Marinimicrobia bacterium]|nr:hypothetical protein [Candidatus Neomarinimicrobiota bacterium]